MKVLILNHNRVKCGTYQMAKRIYEIASRSTQVEYFYKEINSKVEYKVATAQLKPEFELINYHWDRMPWLRDKDLTRDSKHYFIYHDGSMLHKYDKYLFFGGYDLENKDALDKRVLLPRPLFDYYGEYPKNDILTIGSFGFNSGYKKFSELVKLINNQLDEAIINLHMPFAFYGEESGSRLADVINQCNKQITKPGIKLNITSEFLSDDNLLTFLANNDINIFYYQQQDNPGLSSVFDYALSVKRPIAINDCKMFRHVVNDDILLEKHSIKEILNLGTAPLEKFYEQWSTERFSKEMDKLFI